MYLILNTLIIPNLNQPKNERHKMQQMDNSEWKQSCKLQSKKLQTLQKQFLKMLPFNMTTQLRPLIQTWLDQQQSKSNQRYKEQTDIFNRLSSIRGGVGQLRQTLKAYQKKDSYIFKIQSISESIIENMNGFKNHMAKEYEKYAEMQDNLNKQLEMMEIKVNQYEKGEVINEEPIQKNKPFIKQKHKIEQQKQKEIQIKTNDNQGIQRGIMRIQDEMRQFTKQVEGIDLQIRGLGKNLGWIQEDHNDFILLWNRRKHNNYFQFEKECFQQLKTYTMQQIKTHYQKHQKYLDLQQKRKELLYEYKIKKEKKRELQLELVERKQKQQRQQINKIRKESQKAKQDKQTKQKLQYWKMMKQAEKQAMEKQKEYELQKRKLQAADKKRKVQEKKIIVTQWKEQKQVQKQKQIKQKQRSKRPQSAMNKQTLQRIKRKQDQLLLKKMEILRQKQQKEAKKLQQIIKQKKFSQFNYVKSKLDEQTAAMKQKQRSKFDGTNPKDAETFGGNLGIVHARAVPSWRQGI